jgi:hypothetical protein
MEESDPDKNSCYENLAVQTPAARRPYSAALGPFLVIQPSAYPGLHSFGPPARYCSELVVPVKSHTLWRVIPSDFSETDNLDEWEL